MSHQDKKDTVAVFREKASEFVSLTFDVCEEHLARGPKAADSSQKALAAAALCVRASVTTFLAVTGDSDERKGV